MSHRIAFYGSFLAALTLSCHAAPTLPKDITVDGKTFDHSAEWSAFDGQVKGVVFVPHGQSLGYADLQMGVIISTRHRTAHEMHLWLMDEYRKGVTQSMIEIETETKDGACKIGRSLGPPVRTFVAVHVCRDGPKVTVCAEADRRVGDEEYLRWMNGPSIPGSSFHQVACDEMWAARRATVDVLATRVADQH